MLPRLAGANGVFVAGLVIGVVWGAWHLPADYVGLKGYGSLFWLAFLVNGPLVLTAHSLIMAWLWRRSGGNLVLMLAYHWTITAASMVAPTAGAQDGTGLAAAALAAGLFSVVAIAIWLPDLWRRPG